MALEMKIEHQDEYLLAIVAGKYELKPIIGRFTEILKECHASNQNRVLIDIQALEGEYFVTQNVMALISIGERYQQYLKSGGKPLKIAVLGVEPIVPSSPPALETAESFQLRLLPTSDMKVATEWLLSND